MQAVVLETWSSKRKKMEVTAADEMSALFSSPLFRFLCTRMMATTSTLTRSPRKLHEALVSS